MKHRNLSSFYIICGIVAVVVGLFALGNYFAPKPKVNIDPANLPGIDTGPFPWGTNLDALPARLATIGLPQLGTEGTLLHIHQHLDIYINGRHIDVPAGVGIGGSFFSPIHTHDASGVIHVESPVIESFYLGQFFDIWGVRFTADCLGGYCNGNGETLRVFVNGQEYKSDPRLLGLAEHQEIVVTYGTQNELPSPLPVFYSFPSGD